MDRPPLSRSLLSCAALLPAVWSHCLAGGWLGGYLPGAERPDRLALLLAGVGALEVAGSCLRDEPGRRPATGAGVGLLAGGIVLLGLLGWKVLALAVVLAGLTVFRARLPERPSAALALLAGCRGLLYPLASAASLAPALPAAAGEGLLLASYVLGTGFLAQVERRSGRWPWLLLALPLVANAVFAARVGPGRVVVVALPVFWLLRTALGRTPPLGVEQGAAVRAGSILFDLSAVVACTVLLPWLGWFAILFVAALVLARFVPTD